MTNIPKIEKNQLLFTSKNIYRTYDNLNGEKDIYYLNKIDDRFVWEKLNDLTNHDFDVYNYETFESIRYNRSTDEFKSLKYLTIYKCDIDNNVCTHSMIYNDLYKLSWIKLEIPLCMNSVNETNVLNDFDNIPNHINLCNDYICNDIDNIDICDFNDWEIPIYLDNNDNLDKNINDDYYNDKEYKDDYNNDESEYINKDLLDEINKDNYTDYINSEYNEDYDDEYDEEEYRMDITDNRWYSKDEFYEYYGGLVEWNYCDPKIIFLENKYEKLLKKYSHLETSKLKFIFKIYMELYN